MIAYKKFRWFTTSSGKLVVGGKSAEQNDILLKDIISTNKEYLVMHTSSPGSPFSVILSEINDINSSDIEECATFTACFSQAWKQGKSKEKVDIFNSSQLNKSELMKVGTWHVSGKVKTINANLELTLTKQKGVLRAVPISSIKKKGNLLKIHPGKIEKIDIIPKIQIELNESLSQEEILSALPSGGIRIRR